MILNSKIRTIKWENGVSKMIDQTLIPYEYKYVEVETIEKMYASNRYSRGSWCGFGSAKP